MANTSKPEKPPDANQAAGEARLEPNGRFPTTKAELKPSAGETMDAALAETKLKNSNVKKQKISPEIDGPLSGFSEFIKALVKNVAEEFAKATIGKVVNTAEKIVDSVKKVVDFLVPNNEANVTGGKSAEAKKLAEAKTKPEPNKDVGAKAQTKRFLENIANQIKRFTDALTALLNPASNQEARNSSGYLEEGRLAIDGLKNLLQNVSENAPPQLQQYLKRNNLNENNSMLDWLDRLGAALKSGDERALQGFADEWNDFQRRTNRFLNQLGAVSENDATQRKQRVADDEALKRSYQKRPTTLEAEQEKLSKTINRKNNASTSALDRKQNQQKRVLTNIETEQKKLARNSSTLRRSDKIVNMLGKQGTQKRTLTSIQAEQQKLGKYSKHSTADARVPVAARSASSVSKADQKVDLYKMKVPVSKDLALLRTATMVHR